MSTIFYYGRRVWVRWDHPDEPPGFPYAGKVLQVEGVWARKIRVETDEPVGNGLNQKVNVYMYWDVRIPPEPN